MRLYLVWMELVERIMLTWDGPRSSAMRMRINRAHKLGGWFAQLDGLGELSFEEVAEVCG